MVSRNAKGTLSFSFSQRFLCRFRREDNAKIQNFLLPATFTRRFFTKKQSRPLDRAYGIAFPQATPINVNKKLKMKNEK